MRQTENLPESKMPSFQKVRTVLEATGFVNPNTLIGNFKNDGVIPTLQNTPPSATILKGKQTKGQHKENNKKETTLNGIL
jgi:hypothetical protein